MSLRSAYGDRECPRFAEKLPTPAQALADTVDLAKDMLLGIAQRDAEIARLRAEVGRLTIENAELRAANMGANKPAAANAPANTANSDRKAYQRELMRKRRAAAKAVQSKGA